ncbi:bifunctional diguanylate cyclase/phosphodiesterase [Sedimenticola hydrogenitrophicus]|uniref:bifunctional diguanylate cyclase/phosphodiesterase n=1 Tax=Sedimenticola hydrogenitrophicus TaxID=2967975 RepID=UPI0023AFEEAC|nr:bifunctional diguanylate cyclase/phosphodiesterase [Sedimenticola hydrogenitrophicus]
MTDNNNLDDKIDLAPVVLDQCSIGLFVLGADGRIVNWNRWMVTASGIGVASALGRLLADLLPEVSGSTLEQAIDAAGSQGDSTVLHAASGTAVLPLPRRAAGGAHQMVIVKPLLAKSHHVLVQVFDQGDLPGEASLPPRMAEQPGAKSGAELATLSILSAIADAVITTDLHRNISYMNVVAEKLTGWRLTAAMGLPLARVFQVMDEGAALLHGAIERCLATGTLAGGQRQELILVHRDGIGIAVEASLAPICDEQKNIHGVVLVFRDVSHARSLAAQVSWQASHDTLTGLVNRGSFDDRLDDLLRDAMATGRIHGMLYLDLDQFKIVNDTCGHVAGDELLRQIATRLSQHIRTGDTLARLGGDEFGVLLVDCSEAVVLRIANKMRQAIMDLRFAWDDKAYAIGVSIGVVAITAESERAEQVLSAADTACYAAKDGGRNQVHVYRPDAGEAAQRQGEMHWVARIHSALEEDRFCLYVQPIVPIDQRSAHTGHCEVLIRMRDEAGALVPPNKFIPAAERFGLMPRIDRWVVNQLFNLIGREHETLVLGGYCFAINLSGGSVNDEDTLTYIGEKLVEFRIPPGMISFEITETAAIANLASASYFIRTLKQAGCLFSLDDFGSGLSSFAYLKNLPVDFLKIDGAFIRDLATDPIDRAMVQAINQIGQVMGLKTIAEFVENDQVLGLLRGIGVDFAQGYGIARPMPLTDQAGRLLLGK